MIGELCGFGSFSLEGDGIKKLGALGVSGVDF